MQERCEDLWDVGWPSTQRGCSRLKWHRFQRLRSMSLWELSTTELLTFTRHYFLEYPPCWKHCSRLKLPARKLFYLSLIYTLLICLHFYLYTISNSSENRPNQPFCRTRFRWLPDQLVFWVQYFMKLILRDHSLCKTLVRKCEHWKEISVKTLTLQKTQVHKREPWL